MGANSRFIQDPVEIAGLPTEKGHFRYGKRANSSCAKARRNGDHDLVHVRFSPDIIISPIWAGNQPDDSQTMRQTIRQGKELCHDLGLSLIVDIVLESKTSSAFTELASFSRWFLENVLLSPV